MTAADRVHRPTHTLTASRRRADLIDPRRTPVHDHYTIDLERTGNRWTARAQAVGVARGDGPGQVLEAIGQELDAREARRLTHEAGGDAAGSPLTIDEAVERALQRDVAAVLEVLERTARQDAGAGEAEVTTGDVAQRAGFVADAIRSHGAPRATLELVDEAERRARRALERGVDDGVIVRRDTAELWRAATDDELESAVRRRLADVEDEADR
jgi:hypothetical protein